MFCFIFIKKMLDKFLKEFSNKIVGDEKRESFEPLYKKYFEGTKNLKNNFNIPDMTIENCCMKFKSINNIGYDEVFLSEKQKVFASISPKISFLFPPDNRITENRIGFRFYKTSPIDSKCDIAFFILVVISSRKFLILEKNSDVKDNEDKLFKDNELNCFDIIYNIIKNKFIEKKDKFEWSFPHSLVELLGFCYAIKEKRVKKTEILDPYFPDDFNLII